jgi:hypothetical protein
MTNSAPALRKHLAALRELGCVISDLKPVHLHHCMGGSMRQFGQLRGVAFKTSDWLQIPLAPKYHVGDQGIDALGIETWEARFGTQVSFLERVSFQLGYSVFKAAGLKWPEPL